MSNEYDMFVSYSHADAELVNGWLIPHLELRGLRIGVDHRALGNSLLREEIHGLVNASRYMVAVLTASYLNSGWTAYEREYLLKDDPTNRARRFLPWRFDAIDIPETLRAYTVHDLSRPGTREADLESALHRLGLNATPLGTRYYLHINEAEVSALLQSVRVDLEVLRRLFFRHRPEGIAAEPRVWNTLECARLLALCHSRSPAERFLADLADACGDSTLAEKIRSVATTPAPGAPVPGPGPDPRKPVCLVLVEPSKGDEHADLDAYDITVHRWWSPRNAELAATLSCTAKELEERLPAMIKAALNDLALQGVNPSALEIVLPIELLCGKSAACVERWKLPQHRRSGQATLRPGRSLGEHYPLVLRSLDRWEDGDIWAELRKRLSTPDGVIARLTAGNAAAADPAFNGFDPGEDPAANPKVVGLVAERPLSEHEMEVTVFSGVPLMVWLRHADAASASVADLVDLIGREHQQIAQHVRERRCGPQPDHIATHLALLHDLERRELPKLAPLHSMTPSSR